MRSLPGSVLLAALLLAAPNVTIADTAGPWPDPMAPAFFTSRCCGESWQPTDPRLAGTWTETEDWVSIPILDVEGDIAASLDIGLGDIHIENAGGAWTGTYRWFSGPDEDGEYAITATLTGQGAYDGLSAMALGIVDDDRTRPLRLDGVIYLTDSLPEESRGVDGSSD